MNVLSGFCCRSDKCRPVIIPELLNLNLTRIMASSAILDYDQADKHPAKTASKLPTAWTIFRWAECMPRCSHWSCKSLWLHCGCVVEWRTCNWEVACSTLGRGYFTPRSTQPSIPPRSINEYQLQLGRQRKVVMAHSTCR